MSPAFLAAAALGLILQASAAADPPALFGIALGTPVATLAPCPPPGDDYPPFGKALCVFTRDESLPLDPSGAVSRNFNLPANKPDWLFKLSIDEIGGTVAAVFAVTHGLAHQDEILEALRAKYGKPAAVRHDQMETRLGRKFQRIRAGWKVPGGHVTFLGAEGSIDHGIVTLESNAYSARVAAAARRRQESALKP